MSEKKELQKDRLKKLTTNDNINKAMELLSEEDKLQLIRADANFLFAFENPSARIIEEAILYKIDMIFSIDPKYLTNSLLMIAIKQDMKKYGTQCSLSWSITHALEKYQPSQDVQYYLIEHNLDRMSYSDFGKSYWSEESLIKIVSKKPKCFEYIKNKTPEVMKMAVQKDYNNLNKISPQTVDLCLFILERNPKALPLITIVPNKDVKSTINLLKKKQEVIKALG